MCEILWLQLHGILIVRNASTSVNFLVTQLYGSHHNGLALIYSDYSMVSDKRGDPYHCTVTVVTTKSSVCAHNYLNMCLYVLFVHDYAHLCALGTQIVELNF